MSSRRLDTRDVTLERGALSADDSAHIRKCFHVLDADRQGVIRHDLVDTLFRSLGQTPIDKDMRTWLKESELPDGFTVEQFESFFVVRYIEMFRRFNTILLF